MTAIPGSTIVAVDFTRGACFTSGGDALPIVAYFDDDNDRVFDLRDATGFVCARDTAVYFGRIADWQSVPLH